MLFRIIGATTLVALSQLVMPSAGAVSLSDAIRSALETSPDIRVETNEVLSRQEEIEQAGSGYRPKVDINAAYGYEWSDNATTRTAGYTDGRDLTRKEASITLTQMLFDGYATRSEVARQTARTESASRRIEGISQFVALDTVEVYIDVLKRQELLKLSEANLDAHDRIYRQVELRSKAGVGSTADLDQVLGRRASANANRLADVVNLKDVESHYLRIVGDLPKALDPTDSVEDQLPASLEEAMSAALGGHPTLASAEADVKATLAQYEAADHNNYPKIDLEIGSSWGEDQNGGEGVAKDVTALLRLRYNLYNGGRDKARRKQTAHLINEAKEVRNQTFRQVVESLRLSWASYQATSAQLDSLKEHLDSSISTREAYAKQFNIGKRTLVDLLNVENELFEANRSYTEAKNDNLLAQYRILAGMGSLVNHFGIDTPNGKGTGDEGLEPYSQIAYVGITDKDFAPVLEAPVETPASDSGVEMRIMDWAKAWESGVATEYLSFYSSGFEPGKGVGRDAWENSRRRIIGASRGISVKLSNIAIKAEGDKATARFTQRYRSSSYQDVVTKVMELVREKGEWMIISEAAE